jgi:hypothetical protein
MTTTTEDDEEGQKRTAHLQRCYHFMDRIIQMAQRDFPELSPPEIVFVLGLLKWRYFEQIECLAREYFSGEQAPKAASPTEVN